MPLILIILALVLLKYFEVWKFATMSWWWVVGAMAVAFIWFEFVEKIFGLDKKKDHALDAKRREERIKKTFEDNKRRK